MGTSTDAILAYGFDLGEEIPMGLVLPTNDLGDDNDCTWEEFLKAQSGIPEPSHDDYEKDWPEYWAAQRAFAAAFPIEMIEHCSGSCPMYFLALNGTKQEANRGHPEPVGELVPPPLEKRNLLADFCAKHGIEWQDPDWHIFSYWG